MAVFTNVPNSVLDPGDPIRSVDIIAIKENTNFLNEKHTTNVQTFNASGTWTKPTLNGTGVGTMARIQVWGGGGGAARSSQTFLTYGGGGGGYNEVIVPVSSLDGTVTVTIGAGGAGRSGSSGSGSNGGNTTFGSVITGFGGGGAYFASNEDFAGGGGGGSVSGGALNVNGLGHTNHWGGGPGVQARSSASSVFGGGAGAYAAVAASNGLSAFGGNGGDRNQVGVQPSGGGGASSSANGNGFAGAAGRCVVTVF
jgi:hypothetical protein